MPQRRKKRPGAARSPALQILTHTMAGRLGALAARAISHAGAGCSGPHSLAPALTALHGARILGSPLARGQWFHPDAGKSAPSAPWVSTGEWRSFAASARENAADEPKSEASQLNYRRETRGDEASAGRAPSAPPSGTWISTLLPPAAQPYAKLMRLDAPIGTWLLLWPGYWCVVRSPSSNNLYWLSTELAAAGGAQDP